MFVCTANVCRSPVAAALARRRLHGTGIMVSAAGILPGERPVDPVAVEVLAAHGLAVDGEPSRRLTTADVRRADLVLCLERRHLREVVVLDRDALRKSFTIRELVRRGDTIGPRPPGTALAAWLDAANGDRELSSLTGEAPDDDIADPTGGPITGYEHTVRWIDALLGRLVGLLWPPGTGAFDDDDEADERGVTTAEAGDARVEVWRNTASTTAVPATVGIVVDRLGLRLARSISATLTDLGLEPPVTTEDSWVAHHWADCAAAATVAVAAGDVDVAVALTGSGTGATMLANRHPGVRAALATNVTMARRARRAWGANILFLGVEEVTLVVATDIMIAFLREGVSIPAELDDGPPLVLSRPSQAAG
ncbi:MAG: RpiB/LacA/LacB family sugar-phosphate isomerase [Acidimicrobiia bacterium]|nr:RpiB/LacA/LacB family sugar-phosphate isomerase [Acidimicrobiia bacterium]